MSAKCSRRKSGGPLGTANPQQDTAELSHLQGIPQLFQLLRRNCCERLADRLRTLEVHESSLPNEIPRTDEN
jgi:hypothetical protein